MARLCLACQSTLPNHAEHCVTCGRHLTETDRAWARGARGWHAYLEATGWYPHRRDDWVEERLRDTVTYDYSGPSVPRRLTTRYLGGHPDLPRPSRVALNRDDKCVVMTAPGRWPGRPIRVEIPLTSVRTVRLERTNEQTPDDVALATALGTARSGPIGMAFGNTVGRRRRVVRTVHVFLQHPEGRVELVFRDREDQNELGSIVLMRIFQRL